MDFDKVYPIDRSREVGFHEAWLNFLIRNENSWAVSEETNNITMKPSKRINFF